MVISKEKISKLYPFESKYLEIRNYRYHYIDEGDGDAIIMLHGNPTWSFLFRNLVLGLKNQYRVIVPDHLGCGFSDKPQDYNYRLELHIDNLEDLVMHLHLKKVTLLMHDWGAAIGMGFATRYPERIKRLIITNSVAFSMPGHIPLRIAFCRIPRLGEILIRKWNLFSLAAVRMTVAKPLSCDVREAYIMPYDSFENRIAVYSFVKDIPMSFRDSSYELIKNIESGIWMFRESPVLLIWGMKDWCFTPKFLKKWIDFLPNAKVVRLENACHWLFEDEPGEILQNVREFMEKK